MRALRVVVLLLCSALAACTGVPKLGHHDVPDRPVQVLETFPPAASASPAHPIGRSLTPAQRRSCVLAGLCFPPPGS